MSASSRPTFSPWAWRPGRDCRRWWTCRRRPCRRRPPRCGARPEASDPVAAGRRAGRGDGRRRDRARGGGALGRMARVALGGEAREHARDAGHLQDTAFGLTPHRLEPLSLRGIDQDREHDPVIRIDHDLGQAAGAGEGGAGGVDRHRLQGAQHVVAGDGQGCRLRNSICFHLYAHARNTHPGDQPEPTGASPVVEANPGRAARCSPPPESGVTPCTRTTATTRAPRSCSI